MKTWIDDAEQVTVTVVNGVVTLAGRVDRWSSAEIAVRLTRQIPGVVAATSTLEHAFDDRGARGVRLDLGVA